MKKLWKITMVAGALVFAAMNISADAAGTDFIVYSIYRATDLGNPGEISPKDFYVNMGAAHGLSAGSKLEVVRKVATYDLASQKLYKDISFPIARLKVIHVEGQAAVARLESMIPADKVPAFAPRSVIVGDLIRMAN